MIEGHCPIAWRLSDESDCVWAALVDFYLMAKACSLGQNDVLERAVAVAADLERPGARMGCAAAGIAALG